MDAPASETDCLAVLPFWNLTCRLELSHKAQHFGDDGVGWAGYWGRGVVHIERVSILQPV